MHTNIREEKKVRTAIFRGHGNWGIAICTAQTRSILREKYAQVFTPAFHRQDNVQESRAAVEVLIPYSIVEQEGTGTGEGTGRLTPRDCGLFSPRKSRNFEHEPGNGSTNRTSSSLRRPKQRYHYHLFFKACIASFFHDICAESIRTCWIARKKYTSRGQCLLTPEKNHIFYLIKGSFMSAHVLHHSQNPNYAPLRSVSRRVGANLRNSYRSSA